MERRRLALLVPGAALAGACSALAAAGVRLGFRGLQWVLTGSSRDLPVAAAGLSAPRRFFTPVLGALLAGLTLLLWRWRAQRAGKPLPDHVEYVEAVRERGGRIPLVPNCWRTLSAAFSVASGAAVGREGSMIQFAATAASVGAQRGFLRTLLPPGDNTLPLLVACGVAGGVTTAYNAPVAGAFFAAEIVLGGIRWRELALLLTASGAGWCVSAAVQGRARLYPVALPVVPAPAQAWPWLAGVLLAGLVVALAAGLLGPIYQWQLRGLRGLGKRPVALLLGGAVVGLCSAVDPRVWGNGDAALRSALDGAAGVRAAEGLLALLALRLVATTVCVGSGTVGGVFTPTLFAGGALGALLGAGAAHVAGSVDGSVMGPLWAIAGMVGLLAAVTHAPLMAACMGAELTGAWPLLPFLLLLAFVASGLARRLSPRALYAIASPAPAQPPLPSRPAG